MYGKDGQVALFYRNIHIANFPLGVMSMEDYKYNANKLILDGMRDGMKIPQIIHALKLFCESIRYLTWDNNKKKKYKRKEISLEDYRLFLGSLFALVKLQIVDEDDAFFIIPKKGVLKSRKKRIT
jgi:hypothetical protein